ncbi:MAG: M1 family metallopeptidase [Chromatiales bacterium]|nr:M1 family metallopeptidase [Chromatiales bacterium]
MRVSVLLQILILFGLSACQPDSHVEQPDQSVAPGAAGPALQPEASISSDPYSYANYLEFSVRHMDMKLTVDFDARILTGMATLNVERLAPQATSLVLDTRGLNIQRVSKNESGAKLRDLPWQLGQPDSVLGAPLEIDVSSVGPAGRFAITIHYSTRPEAEALQWLEPSMTAGGESPFLYSLAETIHARSWIPVQDTPAVRMTYSARLQVPPGLTALMSARSLRSDFTTGEFTFAMEQEIPAYLIAIAVGDLEYSAFGPRSGIWAEPSVIEAAAAEFEDTPTMIVRAEELFGPYQWEQYDLLVLPPAFSLGGMEHPRLSFITPTLIAGDKSLVGTVAHELAHSWSGNLVTNASWKHLWLNEGFTTYVEMRLVEALYGEAQQKMEEVIAYQELLFELSELPAAEQSLVPAKILKNPDDAFTGVAYQKGAQFMVFLEQAFGRPAFDSFLKRYFSEFAFRSASTDDFMNFLQTHLVDTMPGRVSQEQLHEWVYEPGMPAGLVRPESHELNRINVSIANWLKGEIELRDVPAADWSTQQWQYLIGQIPADVDHDQLLGLDERFELTDSGNAVIVSNWMGLAIRTQFLPAYRRLEPFLTQVGRSYLIDNIYRALSESTPEDRELAREIYRKASRGYHPIARPAIEALLYPGGED